MATITCTTSAVTFTESTSTVARDRVFTTSTEAVSFTEASAPINRTLHIDGTSTEIIAFVENAALVGIYKGTIDVTMPLLVPVAVGDAGLLNTLFEAATAESSFGGMWDFELHEIALASEQFFAFYTNTLTETANASDAITSTAGPTLHETATATNTYGTVWYANIVPRGWKRGTESFDFALSESLTDVVNVTDTLVTHRLTNLHESGYANNVLTVSTSANNTLTSTVEAGDDLFGGAGELLASTVNVTDTQTYEVVPTEILTDTVNATDTQTGVQSWYAEMLGELIATEQLAYGSSISNNTLTSVVLASEVIWAADLAAIAWVLNTETSGLSTYNNYEFTSLAWHDGVLYGVSPAGLFSLTGDDDQGRNIAANVKTGFLDFDIPQTKRMSDLYVGYTGGELECDIESYDGPQEVYTYQLEEREADAPRNNRMKVGKGLSSRYWRFDFKNINGADFQLYNMEANIGRSKRRL